MDFPYGIWVSEITLIYDIWEHIIRIGCQSWILTSKDLQNLHDTNNYFRDLIKSLCEKQTYVLFGTPSDIDGEILDVWETIELWVLKEKVTNPFYSLHLDHEMDHICLEIKNDEYELMIRDVLQNKDGLYKKLFEKVEPQIRNFIEQIDPSKNNLRNKYPFF